VQKLKVSRKKKVIFREKLKQRNLFLLQGELKKIFIDPLSTGAVARTPTTGESLRLCFTMWI